LILLIIAVILALGSGYYVLSHMTDTCDRMIKKCSNLIKFIKKTSSMNTLARMMYSQRDRLIANAWGAHLRAQNPDFKKYWLGVYHHLLKQYNRLN